MKRPLSAASFTAFLLLPLMLTGSRLLAEGLHTGERDKLDVRVEFLDQRGFTTTDISGITYHVYGWEFHEAKIYPPSTYGKEYPLYFMGETMRFKVLLTNTAEKGSKSFKIRVNAVNYVMETTGFGGQVLAPAQDWIVPALGPGETQILQGEIRIPNDPTLPSGLDLTKVRIYHLNNGENTGAAFIMEETATWCPPRMHP